MFSAGLGGLRVLDGGLGHLQVASPGSLGLLAAWRPLHNETSDMGAQGFRCGVLLANKVETARAFMMQPWETPATTPLCFIDGSCHKPAQAQGEGTQTQSLRGEYQCHIGEEQVGWNDIVTTILGKCTV